MGRAEGSELRRVLGGLDPHDGSSLRGSTSPVRVAGFDLTFSAPKSGTALFGIGDAETPRHIRAADDLAARDAVANGQTRPHLCCAPASVALLPL